MSIHNLNEYAISKQIVDDYPRILAILQSLEPALTPHSAYMGVSLVLQAVYDAQVLLKRQLKQAQRVKETKGRVIE